MTEPQKSTFTIEFVDPLFAVAIEMGFDHGLLNEPWFLYWRLPLGDEWIRFATFSLGMLTLVLAWIAYHSSIRKRPVKAFGRFSVDVTLVILYGLLLVKYNDLHAVLLLLVGIYALYVLWDVFKSREYSSEYAGVGRIVKRYRRELITFGWFIAFIILWFLYRGHHVGNIAALVLAYIATIAHRINKQVPIWGALGQWMSKTFLKGTDNDQTNQIPPPPPTGP